jgi:hypothetical protein
LTVYYAINFDEFRLNKYCKIQLCNMLFCNPESRSRRTFFLQIIFYFNYSSTVASEICLDKRSTDKIARPSYISRFCRDGFSHQISDAFIHNKKLSRIISQELLILCINFTQKLCHFATTYCMVNKKYLQKIRRSRKIRSLGQFISCNK